MDFHQVSPLQQDGATIHAVVETPRGYRTKIKFEEDLGLFSVAGVLPEGHSFPYDFGFVPRTEGEDGDPIDVLLLLDEPLFPGCIVPSRLIGVIEAEQEEEGRKERNDRLIAVASRSHAYEDVSSLGDLSKATVEGIEHFFISYNEFKNKEFRVLGRGSAKKAMQLLRESMKKFAAKK